MKMFKRGARLLLGISTLPIVGAWLGFLWLELNRTNKCGTK